MAGVENVDIAWNIVSEALTPRKQEAHGRITNPDLEAAVDILQQSGLGCIVQEWFTEKMQQDLRDNIAPKFWSFFNKAQPKEDPEKVVYFAFNELYDMLSVYFPVIKTLELIRQKLDSTQLNLKDNIHLQYKAIIFFSPPKIFHETIHDVYSQAFKVFHSKNRGVFEDEEEDQDEESLKCQGCEALLDACCCKRILESFQKLNHQLDELGLLERISGDAVITIINQRIKLHIDHTCKGNFETLYLPVLQNWLDCTVLGWLNLIYGCGVQSHHQICVGELKTALDYYLHETYANARIDQLFNIIIEFPESEPALEDLKVCLEKTDLRSHLVKSLKSALENRLLHPGVNTTDILTAYISAIRALRVLDSTGVILELVCEPVRKYLRSRDDTVRCIVASLTEDSNNELSEELFKGHSLVLDESCISDEEDEDWEKWMPDPVDADPAKTSKSRRTSDIISMLVNIYGSKELFVNEYRALLADRILTQFSYDTEREIRNLEFLKLRFGESQLHYCEVMLKDVADSKRINSHITEQRDKEQSEAPEEATKKKEEIPVNSLILSAQFWPSFREEKIELPEIMNTSLETYTKAFETLKGNRTLNWKPHLGLMDIDIELKNHTLHLKVSPVHAAIIMQFQEQDRWTVNDLSAALHMPTSALRRKITYWQSQGLLKEETTDTFVLVEEQKGRTHDVVMVDEDEAESAMASQHDQREEEMNVFWSYIVGMLTNLESLPLERIHSMLKIFAMQGPTTSECSLQELKAFLDKKVKDQKLTFSGGVYRLSKQSS